MPLLVVAGLIAVAHVADALGRRQLPGRPLVALFLMEVWIVSPLMWGALAASAIVILAVAFNPAEGTPTDAEQLAKSLAAAITAFLTAGFISWSGDKDKSPVAKRTKKAFQQAYKNVDLPEDVERFVYSDAVGGMEGWSWPTRFQRAQKVKSYLDQHGVKAKLHPLPQLLPDRAGEGDATTRSG